MRCTQPQRMHTHRCIYKILTYVWSGAMYPLSVCSLPLYATLGCQYLLYGMPACVVPVWFYAWSGRQMFIPQGVYSHTHAHTPGYTLFYYCVHTYRNIIQHTINFSTQYTHTHTYIPVLSYCETAIKRSHFNTHTYMHTHTYTHTHTHTHTCTQTCTHTHTCRAHTHTLHLSQPLNWCLS